MKYDGTELKYQIVNKQQFIYKNGVYTKIFFKGKCYSFGQYVHPLHKIHQPPLMYNMMKKMITIIDIRIDLFTYITLLLADMLYLETMKKC